VNSAFASYHPIINFTYFLGIIFFTMFFMHPFLLVISLTAAFIYSLWLGGRRAFKFNLVFLLPMLFIVVLINPLFNHEGATILFYLRENPITRESIIYGIASAVMFVSVILWFSCYNKIMTSDKFMYVFGRLIPALSLIISMVLRFVPMFKAQLNVISAGQKAIGRDVSQGNLLDKAKNGLKILSILITWALENAIETADSMRARGYGLKGRTSFSLFRFDARDKALLVLMLLCIAVVMLGAFLGKTTIDYFPLFVMGELSSFSITVYVVYVLFAFLPLILDVVEELKWQSLKA
jgi:energy-coupling factor transport system permease protein